ncbi:hypothetical protein [Snodgrassella communis]|uniref:Uncharacterized protein n=1 Tax=Snodgrassella alvi TaxID=1196083 RepID=A0A2N9XPD3_9NEIS|nr:hypothetical protein [Snodgrassella communis]PIT50188.1 hypothetical protein BHC48_07220 [Snodgrassella communis]
MFVTELAKSLSPDFIVFHDFVKLCGCSKVATVLSKFIWWAQVCERKNPERNGWFYQTHKDFIEQFALKRRGYEKARKVLVEQLGVLEYRRAGFFGRMNWRVNAEKLQAQLCRLRGRGTTTPVESNFHQDRDGYWLPKSIPLEQWHLFLDSRTKKTGRLQQSIQMKRKWVNQLEKLVKEYTEIPAFMTYVAKHGWANFIVHPSVKWDDVIQLQPVVSNMPAVVLKQEESKPPGNSSISPDDVDEIRKNLRSKFNIKGSD